MRTRLRGAATPVAAMVLFVPLAFAETDPLPSWSDSGAKRAIVTFVADTTREGSPTFVPPAERIAVFDNDGTLWAEQPMYFQLAYTLDRVRALAPKHPDWKQKEPFRSILHGDLTGALADGGHAIMALVMATHAGITTEEHTQAVRVWLASARHAIGDRDPLVFGSDGSLVIYVQHDSPGKDKEANWLPAPKDDFNLVMRLYWPKDEIRNGTWKVPPVERVTK